MPTQENDRGITEGLQRDYRGIIDDLLEADPNGFVKNRTVLLMQVENRAQFKKIDQRFDRMDQSMDRMDQRLDKMDSKMDIIMSQVAFLTEKMVEYFVSRKKN
jgi:tetrahydromethanopterin S-methyltransferase subunit G